MTDRAEAVPGAGDTPALIALPVSISSEARKALLVMRMIQAALLTRTGIRRRHGNAALVSFGPAAPLRWTITQEVARNCRSGGICDEVAGQNQVACPNPYNVDLKLRLLRLCTRS